MISLLFLFLALSLGVPPDWEIFDNQNNVANQAVYHSNTNTVKWLGDFNNINDCENACLSYSSGGQSCLSFTWFSSSCNCNLTQGCYAHVDPYWHPTSQNGVSSSRDVNHNADPLHPNFHAGPIVNWMNDPNGPMYFNGLYHLFFQYNPYGSEWGSMSWGHVTSPDLVHWTEQVVAMYPDQNYDNDGVFSGSAVVVDGNPTLIYTCVNSLGQQQCIAKPKNTSDPLLLDWVKSSLNPVIRDPPPGGDLNDFRDDTTPWLSNGAYYMAIGTNINGNGAAYLYVSSDASFTSWTPLHPLWTLSTFGSMWECPDFYPIVDVASASTDYYTIKFSAEGRDWYSVGTYDQSKQVFNPLISPLLYDAGQYYASKTFYDPSKKRQILWGWVAEDGGNSDENGWQGVQSFPRLVQYDSNLQQLLFNPIEEISLLRDKSQSFNNVKISSGNTYKLTATGNQLEVMVNYDISTLDLQVQQSFGVRVLESSSDSQYTEIGVTIQNLTGPLNNTDLPGDEYRQFYYDTDTTEDQRISICEQTCVNESSSNGCISWTYVRQGYFSDGKNPIPMDPSPRCSLKNGIPAVNPSVCCVSGALNKQPTAMSYVNRAKSGGGNTGNMGGNFNLYGVDKILDFHILVDHSIIESFFGGGRHVVTSRVYPSTDGSNNYGISILNKASGDLVVNATVTPLFSAWS